MSVEDLVPGTYEGRASTADDVPNPSYWRRMPWVRVNHQRRSRACWGTPARGEGVLRLRSVHSEPHTARRKRLPGTDAAAHSGSTGGCGVTVWDRCPYSDLKGSYGGFTANHHSAVPSHSESIRGSKYYEAASWMVPKGGLEPPRVSPYAPQTYVSTNSTTSAKTSAPAL